MSSFAGDGPPDGDLQPIADINDAEHFRDDAGRPVLLGCHCTSCGNDSFPFQALCSACGSRATTTLELPRNGVLYSYSVVHISSSRPTPYAIGYVDLANGVRLLANLRDSVSPLRLDGPVKLATDGRDWFFEACP